MKRMKLEAPSTPTDTPYGFDRTDSNQPAGVKESLPDAVATASVAPPEASESEDNAATDSPWMTRRERKAAQRLAIPHWAREDEIQRAPKPPPLASHIATMRMTEEVLQKIKRTIGSRRAESGGMLLSSTGDYTIDDYVFDHMGDTNAAVYQPNVQFLNRELQDREEHFVGIVHSHPPGYTRLSPQDLHAAWCNMTSKGNPHLNAYLMPIIQTIPDTGNFELIPFIVTCHPDGMGQVNCKRVSLEII